MDSWMTESNRRISSFLGSCMSSKGFVRNGAADGCILSGEEWQVACYKAR
jgi:hypothetical protein